MLVVEVPTNCGFHIGSGASVLFGVETEKIQQVRLKN